MDKLEIGLDDKGNQVVIIPDILFVNKQNIDWPKVEVYLQKYVGDIIEIVSTKDVIYLGDEFPDEYAGSKYTRHLKGARAKAKSNAVQGIHEMVEIATGKTFHENRKEKHSRNAGKGWYNYITRFAIPISDNERKTNKFNIFTARIVVNHARNGKLYLYDIVDIKKEASNPLKTSK